MPEKWSRLSQTQLHHQQIIERIQADFEAFRSQSKPRSRIPAELRRAALEALRAGVAPDRLCRACNVARNQLERWQQLAVEGGGKVSRGAVADPSPRILSVVSDTVGEATTVEPKTEEQPTISRAHRDDIELDVRLASWRLSLRLTPITTEY